MLRFLNQKRIQKQLIAEIDELERRIIKHEDEVEMNSKAIRKLNDNLEKASSEDMLDTIYKSIQYYEHNRNYHFRKIDKYCNRQDGLKLALKIING